MLSSRGMSRETVRRALRLIAALAAVLAIGCGAPRTGERARADRDDEPAAGDEEFPTEDEFGEDEEEASASEGGDEFATADEHLDEDDEPPAEELADDEFLDEEEEPAEEDEVEEEVEAERPHGDEEFATDAEFEEDPAEERRIAAEARRAARAAREAQRPTPTPTRPVVAGTIDAPTPPIEATPRAAETQPRFTIVAPPTRATAGAPTCTLSDAVPLGGSQSRPIEVGVAFASPSRGMVVWSADESHVRTRPVGDEVSIGAINDVEIRHAHGLELVAPAGNGFVALASEPLCANGRACFRARGLRADGSPAGPALEERPDDQMPGVRAWAVVEQGFVAAQAWRFSPGRIARYRLQDDGTVALDTLREWHEACAGDTAFEALLAEQGRILAITHPECTGDRRAVPVPEGESIHVRGLGGDSRIVHAAIAPDGRLQLVFRGTTGAPRYAMIGSDGQPVEPPVFIRADTTLPSPIGDHVLPHVAVTRGRVVFSRTDAAGRAIGAPIDVASPRVARIEAEVAWTGADFAVVYLAREGDHWSVSLRRVRCG